MTSNKKHTQQPAFTPLRIALLGYRSHPHVGGQGIYLKYLSRALTALGHQVDVLSGPPYPELDPNVHLIKIPSLNLYENPKHIRALRWHHLRSWADTYEWWTMATGGFGEPYTFGRRVYAYLRDHGRHYHVIHDNQSLCYGLLKLQQDGFPVMSSIHHPITRDFELALREAPTWGHEILVKRWYSFLSMQKKVAQQLNHVTTVSEFSRNDISNQFDRPIDKTQVITNGIDSTLFHPSATIEKIPWRIITTTSSDQAIKGFDVLLKALVIVLHQHPKAHLRVIGKLKENGRNEALIDQLKLRDHISFIHGISHDALVNEYAQASVAVCPSLYEGFGLPAAEAMSCGVPLVSSDGGALAEVVSDAGILCRAGDAGALAHGIHKIFSDAELAKKLSIQGRERVCRYFSWERVAKQFTDYYQQHF